MRQVLVFSFAFLAILAVAAHAKKHHVASGEASSPMTSLDSNGTSSKAVQGCYCVKSLSTFGYEQIVIDNAGSGCIGGCGGSDFVFHELGSFIQTINVWFGCGVPRNGMRAIQFTLRNGRSATFGRPCGNANSFTFNAGESLTGNLVLGGNGIGTRTGHLSFTTNLGRKFQVGTLHTPYNYPVEGRFLTGAFGGSGHDIDRLGFIFTKRISGSVLEDLSYPTLASLTTGLSPVLLKQDSSCNQSPVDQTKYIKFTVTEGEDRCWSAEVSMSLEISYSVTAGVPAVASTTAGMKWTVGAKAGYNRCTKTTRAVENQYNLNTPANHRCQVVVTQFDSMLNNLPFRGTLKLFFQDGSTFTLATSGTFSGAYISQSIQTTRCNRLGPSETCSSAPEDADANATALAIAAEAYPAFRDNKGMMMETVIRDDDDDDDDDSTNSKVTDDDDDDDDDDSTNSKVADDDDDDDDDN